MCGRFIGECSLGHYLLGIRGRGGTREEMLDCDVVATELLAILKEEGSLEFSLLRGVAWALIPSSSSRQWLLVAPGKEIQIWAKSRFWGGTQLWISSGQGSGQPGKWGSRSWRECAVATPQYPPQMIHRRSRLKIITPIPNATHFEAEETEAQRECKYWSPVTYFLLC